MTRKARIDSAAEAVRVMSAVAREGQQQNPAQSAAAKRLTSASGTLEIDRNRKKWRKSWKVRGLRALVH
jgi:hypothetical protein